MKRAGALASTAGSRAVFAGRHAAKDLNPGVMIPPAKQGTELPCTTTSKVVAVPISTATRGNGACTTAANALATRSAPRVDTPGYAEKSSMGAESADSQLTEYSPSASDMTSRAAGTTEQAYTRLKHQSASKALMDSADNSSVGRIRGTQIPSAEARANFVREFELSISKQVSCIIIFHISLSPPGQRKPRTRNAPPAASLRTVASSLAPRCEACPAPSQSNVP